MSYGATPDDWINLDLLGLTQDLLPVVSNPNSPISPKSNLKAIGKVPSRYNANRQIAGIPNWTQHKTTPQEIERWAKEPDYGICVQTRNVRALDIDIEQSKEVLNFLSANHWIFPCRFRSNSGKKLLAFRLKGDYSKRVMKTKNGPIEFLATGQHFVAIGTHPSGAKYEGLENVSGFPEITPEEFESLWQALASEFAVEPPSSSSLRNPLTDPNEAVLAAMRDPVVSYLEEHGHVTGLGKEGQIFLTCPFSAEHTERLEGGTSTAYLPAGNREYQTGHFSCLHAHCQNRLDEEFLDAFGYRLADFDVIPPEPDPPESKERFKVIDGHVFSNRPPVDWIIKGVVPKNSFGQIYGGSGDGKTFVALDMALAIARGVPWNGHTVKQGRVVYVCAEGAGGFASRLKAYAIEHGIRFEGLPFGVIPGSPNLRTAEDAKALIKAIQAYGTTDLIFIDTFAQVTPGADENTGKDMSVALRHCELIQKTLNTAVWPLHHSGKDVTRGARGWSGIKAPLDAQICVSKDDDGTRKVWVEKLKDARDGFGWIFTLESIVVGIDADDEETTSCFVKYVSTTTEQRKQKRKQDKTSHEEALILNAFFELGGGETTLPALLECALRYLPPSAGGSRDKRREALTKALGALHARGELYYKDGVITAPLGADE